MRMMVALAGLFLLAAASSASAQQMMTTTKSSSIFSASSFKATPSIFTQVMSSRPNMSPFQTKTPFPGPPNIANMLPSFPQIQNTMLLRNIFGPQMNSQVVPPPKKKS
jgi:hypothetical protein